jgi:DnaJ-class molecular chaperone
MAAIYRAYATLGDKAARAEYDRKRQANSGQASFGDAEDGRKAEAFESALGELEGRCNWLPPFSRLG